MRYFELPTVVRGDDVETPFCIVFDMVSDEYAAILHAQATDLRANIGCRYILVFRERVYLGDQPDTDATDPIPCPECQSPDSPMGNVTA